jgi:protocatechuate 3,4-dioxygenase alpha subunit
MIRTPSQTVGPFYSIGLTRRPEHVLAEDGFELTGRLLDGQEEPIADGMIEMCDGRRWGRSATDADGGFTFRVPTDVDHFHVFVFARGLLRHQLTRIYLTDGPDVPDPTLLAAREDGRLRFDIRMQGDRATLFFEH